MSKQDQFLTKAERLAGIGLATAGVLSVLVFLSFFYNYSWTGRREFSESFYIILYYVFPLGLSVLLFASLRLSAIHKVNLLVFLVASTASMCGAELFLESRYSSLDTPAKPVMDLLANSDDKKKYAAQLTKEFGAEIDTRTSGEVIADLQEKGVDAVPIIAPGNHLFVKQPDGSIKSALNIGGQEVMPLAGLSNKVTILCNENGNWIDYQSDLHGFNNRNEIWQLSGLDVAVLGDSFAHGYCVSPDKTFVAMIQQRYPATLNLGIAGDGPLLMLATLKEYLPAFEPKIVLWFYYEGNDLTDLQIERKSVLLENYLKHGFTQSELGRQSDIDRAMMDEITRLTASEQDNRTRRPAKNRNVIDQLVDFARLSVLRQKLQLIGGMDAGAREMAADLQGPNMDAFGEILSQAKKRVAGWGGQLYFVYLPEWARYTAYSSWGKTKRNDVLALVRKQGIPVVDIDLAFQAYGDPLSLFPFRAVGHYTETGHRLVAEEVLKVVSRERQAPQ